MKKNPPKSTDASTKPRELLPVATYLQQETVDRIDKEAVGEGRKRAQMVRRLIEEALESRMAGVK